MNNDHQDSGNQAVIKKYANRRLYDTDSSSYVTLGDLAAKVREGVDFLVIDAQSGDDITRTILTQIIFEEEGKGDNVLSVPFLRQLVSIYDKNVRDTVPGYFDAVMDSFARNVELFNRESQKLRGRVPVHNLEDMAKQSLAMFEQAVSIFSPFGGKPKADAENDDDMVDSPATAPEAEPEAENAPADNKSEIYDLRAQLKKMQDQINKIIDR